MTRIQAETIRVGDVVHSHYGTHTVIAIRTGPTGGIQFRLEYGGWIKARFCTLYRQARP